MGLLSTANKLDFLQDPSDLKCAALRDAGLFVLGGNQQWLALCNEPHVFRTCQQEVERRREGFGESVDPRMGGVRSGRPSGLGSRLADGILGVGFVV